MIDYLFLCFILSSFVVILWRGLYEQKWVVHLFLRNINVIMDLGTKL